jgi:hypothetical protein
MVLCLPLLLMVMALMINYGTVAAWKVREWSVARHAAWASRHPRSGATRPGCWWPQEATMGAGGAGQIAAMDDPRINLPVVRGPMPFGTTVHDQVLDPTRGPLSGSAGLERDFPLLRTLGPYRINAGEFLLDHEWQHREMGLWTTRDRRIPVIYDLAQADASYTNAYAAAAAAIVYSPFRPNLFPLDRDDEFIYFSQRFANVPTFPYRGAPDFHPVLNLPCSWSCESGCRADHEFVRRQVEDLVDRIRGNKSKDPPVSSLPEQMAGAFRSLYRAVQDQLNDQINATPPPSPAQVAAMQAEIAQLQVKIDILEKFLSTL